MLKKKTIRLCCTFVVIPLIYSKQEIGAGPAETALRTVKPIHGRIKEVFHTRRIPIFFSAVLLTLFLAVTQALACTTIIVGRGASADGSRIFGRTVDAPSSMGVIGTQLRTVPAAAGSGTWIFHDENNGLEAELPAAGCQYVCTMFMPSRHMGVWAENAENEYGVCISATESLFANKAALDADPLVPNGVAESNISVLVIPYVKTAREGVERLARMVERYGSAEGNGVVFADDTETWYMEIYTGHQWAAQKVPDDCYAVIANAAILGALDLSDTDNAMACETIWSLPEEKGFLQKADGKPNLALTYGDLDDYRTYNVVRLWGGDHLFNPSTAGEYDINKNYEPFRKPESPITLRQVMEATRYRFEDTEFSSNLPGSTTRPIGIERAVQCHLFQLRDGKPTILWQCFSPSEFSVYMPLYGNLTSVPGAFDVDSLTADPDSAFWLMRTLSSFGTLDRENYGQTIRATWRALEDKWIAGIDAMDAEYTASGRNGDVAAGLFADIAREAMDEGRNLLNVTLTKFSTNVTKKTGVFGEDHK